MPSAPSKLYAGSLHSLNPLFTIYAGSDVLGDDDIRAEGGSFGIEAVGEEQCN